MRIIPLAGQEKVLELGANWSFRFSTAPWRALSILVLVLLAASAVSMLSGNAQYPLDRVIGILSGQVTDARPSEILVIWDIRLPRLICAVLVGIGLGCSGALFQSLTDNPLGSPDIIGFSSGAATMAVLTLVMPIAWLPGISASAMLGGVLAAVAVYALAWRNGITPLRLILVGVGVTAILSALRAYLIARADLGDAQSAYRWVLGSVDGSTWRDVWPLVWFSLALVPLTVAISRPLDQMAAGNDLAISLGARVQWTRAMVAIVGTLWCAITVAAAGPIAFVALAAPQLARRLVGGSGGLVWTSAVVGAVLVLAADILALRLLSPTQLPTGIVTAVLGGVYLIWLLNQRRLR